MPSSPDTLQAAEQLSAKQRALLHMLLAERQAARRRPAAQPTPAKEPDRIARRTSDGPAPLSFAQQRLWFIDQLDPGNPSFNIPAAIEINGELDVALMHRCLQRIVARHETLRTRFGSENGQPLQIIETSAELALPLVDLRYLDASMRAYEIDRRITGECLNAFDLATCPLLRMTLLKVDASTHVLIMILHHSVGDVWSVRVLMKELVALYDTLRRDVDAADPLPRLPIQYADYAVWQNDWLSGEVLEAETRFWKEHLGDRPDALELPYDRPRPPIQTSRGAKHFLSLPQPLVDTMRTLGQQAGTSLFMSLLAVWNVLLYRYTGQDDVVVGAPVANRNRSELEGLIGFFVNSLVLRTQLGGRPTFRELLAQQRDVVLTAFSHQQFPFEKLVEILQPERDMSRNALYQVDFILQNSPRSAYELEGLEFKALPARNNTAQLDMTLDLWEEGEGIGGWIEYDVDLFDATTVRRIARHYSGVLAAVTGEPDRSIDDLSWLTPAESQQLLREWNDTARRYAHAESIHELIADQARATPEAPALAGPSLTADGPWTRLTYGELAARSAELARRLRALGVAPDQPVGIYMERCVEALVAMVATLEAGGAYMPMDPAYPAERLATVLDDARPHWVLTTRALLPSLPSEDTTGVRGLALDGAWPDAPPASEVPQPVRRGHLAYVIHTSGSTGRPKGIQVTHGNLINAYQAWEDSYGLRAAAKAHLQMASFSFDVFSGDLVRALCSGAKLVLCPRETLLLPDKLYDLMRREEIDAAEFVPAVVRALVQYLEDSSQRLDFMRLMVAGSDAWFADEYRRVHDLCGPETRLINSYGVSEATIDSSFFEDTPDGGRLRPGLVPIGRPFGNNRLIILDEGLSPAPIGMAGELYIAGYGVSRGYLHQARQNAEKFLPDPYAINAGERLYRTQDRARFLASGDVHFLGRLDHQIKIRGYRIELGEIESTLGQHAAINAAVVATHRKGAADPQLVAYLELDGTEEGFDTKAADSDQARDFERHVGATLPDYMVPSVWIVLARLPVLPNGKINRRALPAPDNFFDDERPKVAPRTPVEEVLCDIWREVLETEVGVTDNLFELGAHSLLLTQVVSRMRERLDVELSLRTFFEGPNVEHLARAVERLQDQGERPGEPPIVRVDRDTLTHLPLSFTQERMFFLDQLEPGLSAYNVPGAVHMHGPLDVPALQAAYTEIVRRHEIFRTTYEVIDSRATARLHQPEPFLLPIVDLEHLPEGEREALAMAFARANARAPFDLQNGPVLRARLVRLADERHLLAMTTHHIAYDMWAREIFIFELGTLYRAFTHRQPSPLPEPEIQFVDYAAWQRGYMQGEVLAAELGYWRDQLAGAPGQLELPIDLPRPAVQSYRGARQYLRLPKEVARGVDALSRRCEATTYITLMAAFKALLYRYSHQTGLAVGSPIANRNRVEVEGLIGFLANTLVLYTDLGGRPDFLTLLGRVRESALGAYAHQDVPFELLVHELQPERDMSRSPLFQVMFNYMQSYSAPSVDLDELTLELDRMHSGAAMFEINIDMWETEEGFAGVVEYCTDLFHHTTITRLAVHFENLLHDLVAHPERQLDELHLLSAAERHQLRHDWNDSRTALPTTTAAADLPLDAGFLERFDAWVDHTPNATAAVCDGQRLDYRQLAQRSDALAAELNARGIGHEHIVALLAERDLDFLTAVLAVMKVGAAYLPLNPDHPPARLATVVRASGAVRVLAGPGFGDRLAPALARAEPNREDATAKIDSLPALLARADAAEGHELRIRPPRPENLAYVIYTSGSTGLPKGVLLEHRGMLNHLYTKQFLLDLAPGDRVAQTASQTFDISVWQFLLPLMTGAEVHVYRDEISHDPAALVRRVAEDGITILETVPSMMQAMVAAAEGAELAPDDLALRWLMPTGEALPPALAARWLERYPSVPLVNAYGPTECSDDVSCAVIRQPPGEDVATMPIGRPLENLRLDVVDSRLEPVPIGVHGELVVGGIGVGRGYLGDPRRTATTFLPTSQEDTEGHGGARLYRTGDRVRLTADGTIHFLGRIDHQVKVRGYRIELGEIESALGRLPQVAEAVVLARGEEGSADKRLVAYVRPVDVEEELLDAATLRTVLKDTLPDYMVPSFVVTLPQFPVTAAGKIDRKALPAPTGQQLDARTYVEPRDDDERILTEIFSEILGIERVGVHDDFFDLGGHSLLGLQVVARVRDRFGVDAPLRVLFENSTVAGMAEAVRVVRWAGEATDLESTEGFDELDEDDLEEGAL
ncbi:MAG: amino acid adenylation domain-containing protein [Acidobacteriota bacterium]